MVTQAVEAAQVYREAKKRIDRGRILKSVTFYSKLDRWLYDASLDSKVCRTCRFYEDNQPVDGFPGDWLRINFPYHIIDDVDEVSANVHPHCRCKLKRVINPPEKNDVK